MTKEQNIPDRFSRLQKAVTDAYPDRKTFPNLDGYTCAILHEAAHALMAFQRGLRVHHIRVEPWGSGGGAGISDVPYSWPPERASKVAAEVYLAGFMADHYFQSVSGSAPRHYFHDIWLALACLERGELAAQHLQLHYVELQRNRELETPAEIGDAMREAHKVMLSKTPTEYVVRIREKRSANKEIIALRQSVSRWFIESLDALEFLVGFVARRRATSRNFKIAPALRKAQKLIAR